MLTLLIITLVVAIASATASVKSTNVTSGGSDESQEWISAHNLYREKHCVGNLTWDSDLATSAEMWARKLLELNAFRHPETQEEKAKYLSNQGQNLGKTFGGTSTPKEQVKRWYDEMPNYNFSTGQFSPSTGHFTQVVWKDTNRVGCAKASNSKEEISVCNYSPPGNVMNQFTRNVVKC